MFSCMDSNHDLLNQNQTCYHCTTGKLNIVEIEGLELSTGTV